MFGYKNKEIVTCHVEVDAGAAEVYALWRAPEACEVAAAAILPSNDLAAHADNWITAQLLNYGTAGANVGTVGTMIDTDADGGSASFAAFVAEAFTIDEGTLAVGEIVVLSMNEAGTVTWPSPMVVQLEVLYGVGADA